eukprot:gene10981-biopygen6330
MAGGAGSGGCMAGGAAARQAAGCVAPFVPQQTPTGWCTYVQGRSITATPQAPSEGLDGKVAHGLCTLLDLLWFIWFGLV